MTPPSIILPGVGAGLLLGQQESSEKSPDQLLREREVEKLQFPAWLTDMTHPEHTVAPILAAFARVLVQEELGTGLDDLPKLRTLVDRLEGTKLADKRVLSGKELKRLVVLADHVVRKFLPNAMTFVGGSDVARPLRDLPPLRTAGDVVNAERILDRLAITTSSSVDLANPNEQQFLLVNALSFGGLFVKSLVTLLRTIQDALVPATAPKPAGFTLSTTTATAAEAEAQGTPKPTGDVLEVDGRMVYDLVKYAFSVYGSARVLSLQSLGGKGAQREVDRMGLACLGEMLGV